MITLQRPGCARFPARALLFALLMTTASPALSEILIARGDTVHVSITEAPKLGGDSKVDAEGNIVLPQLGSVQVAGMGLDAARARLEAELIKRDILKAPTVLVEIAKYRPFYVGGKVARPGAIEYEPGLTVRHALILAGGAGRSDEDRLASVDVPGLRAKWQTTNYQLLDVNSRIARLQAELVRNEHAQVAVAPGVVPAQDAQVLETLDQKILMDRLQTWSGSQAHLRDGMALLDLEIDVLGQQASLQEKERDIDSQQVDAAQKLVDKGLMPLPRLQELQHEQSRATRDLLENRAYIARAKQNRSTVEYELNSADIKWRIDIRQQLREAMLDRVRLKAELDALSAQILDAGVSLSEAESASIRTVVVIYRTAEGREETLKAQMDTEVLPGDVLDVSVSNGASG
ncbi:MAG: polysaccharide biosynthesis/export family protein [Mesorhizobium sp.]|jgi:polysaccharide export outer membrane protein